MKHHLTEKELIEYQFKLASDTQMKEAAAHIEACADCHGNLEKLQRKYSALDLLGEKAEISEDLISSVIEQARRPVVKKIAWFKRPVWMSSAAAVLVIGLLLVINQTSDNGVNFSHVIEPPVPTQDKIELRSKKSIAPMTEMEAASKPEITQARAVQKNGKARKATLAMAPKEGAVDMYAAKGKASDEAISEQPPFAPASAIELVTLPRRDKVQLTIYNSAFQTSVSDYEGYGGFGGMSGPGNSGGYGGGYIGGNPGVVAGIQEGQINDTPSGLIMVIQETVEPDSWFDISDTGEGTIKIHDNKKLVVRQTREIHQKIEKLIRALKSLPGEQLKSKSSIAFDRTEPLIYRQIEQIVNLSDLKAKMTFGEVIEKLKKSVRPPIQIQPNWKDLHDNAEVEPTTPARMGPLRGIKLRKALEILLSIVTSSRLGEFGELTYVVDEGVILIGTLDMLPPKMETRVYDISDLDSSVGTTSDSNTAIAEESKELDIKQRFNPLRSITTMTIQETIDPDSWFDLSDTGDGTIQIHDNKKLVVRQTRENHQKIEKLLQAMKSLPGEQLKSDFSISIEQNSIEPLVYKQIDQIVDLSDLKAEMTFGEVIEKLENSVRPPIQIQPNWKDLLDSAEVEPSTPAKMGPLMGIKLRKALEILISGVTSSQLGKFGELTYVVDEGVILIGTVDVLRPKMEVRVYDISDLDLGTSITSNSDTIVVEENKVQNVRRHFGPRRPVTILPNSLTLVRERRNLTMKKGWNWLQFMWANTLIDPTSLSLEPLEQGDKIDIEQLVFPARLRELGRWLIHSEVSGQVPFEITYFTSGISWRAFYMGTLTEDEKTMQLQGYVRVANNSGEDYEEAETRLIVGNVHILDEIAELARRQYPYNSPISLHMKGELSSWEMQKGQKLEEDRYLFFNGDAARFGKTFSDKIGRKEIRKEGLSEYFLYTIEGTETIPNQWGKRLLSFEASDIEVESLYKYDEQRWGNQAIRFVKFANDEEHNLGETPIPNGDVKIYGKADEQGLLSYVGGTNIKYIPVDEEVELNLGPARLVKVEPKLMDFKTDNYMFDRRGNVTGWDEIRTWKIEIINTRELPIEIEVTRGFNTAYWTLQADAAYEKYDATHARFEVNLQPRIKRMLEYTVTTYHGTREGVSAEKN